MGLLKKLFGNAADELKKSFGDVKQEMLQNLEDAKNDALAGLGFKSSKSSTTSRNNDDVPKPKAAVALANKQDSGKKLWWVNDLELMFDGNKYALKYTGTESKSTPFIYDDVDILNDYQARLAQKQEDGSMRYGVACTCGFNLFLTDCEYTKISFLDGNHAIFALDEEGDRYAIDRWGNPYSLEAYIAKEMKE